MNKRLKKKFKRTRNVTKKDAQIAWNVVARYLNNHPELSFTVKNWPGSAVDSENRYTLSVLAGESLFIAGTTWSKGVN